MYILLPMSKTYRHFVLKTLVSQALGNLVSQWSLSLEWPFLFPSGSMQSIEEKCKPQIYIAKMISIHYEFCFTCCKGQRVCMKDTGEEAGEKKNSCFQNWCLQYYRTRLTLPESSYAMWAAVWGLLGMEWVFFTAAHAVLSFWFVAKALLITPRF